MLFMNYTCNAHHPPNEGSKCKAEDTGNQLLLQFKSVNPLFQPFKDPWWYLDYIHGFDREPLFGVCQVAHDCLQSSVLDNMFVYLPLKEGNWGGGGAATESVKFRENVTSIFSPL